MNGGLQIDGSEIAQVDSKEIEAAAAEIKRQVRLSSPPPSLYLSTSKYALCVLQEITAIAIISVYAPIDFTHAHESHVASLLASLLPASTGIVCSKDISNLGLLERENATIMNAALLRYAKHTTASFERAAHELGLGGRPVFVTSNDGTLLSCEEAGKVPIRTL